MKRKKKTTKKPITNQNPAHVQQLFPEVCFLGFHTQGRLELAPADLCNFWWLHFQNKSQEISHGRVASLGDSLGGHQQDARGRMCERKIVIYHFLPSTKKKKKN